MDNLYFFEEEFLVSESDVEQKVIFPLLTNAFPMGLGHNPHNIITKNSLKRIMLGKGETAKLYYPDYVVSIDGVPCCIIEAKKPHENLTEAYREACLYATELNRFFDSDINPVRFVVACDGQKLLCGHSDALPSMDIVIKDFFVGNNKFINFIEEFCYQSLKKYAEEILKKSRKVTKFHKPIYMLGGKVIQNKQTKNSFGDDISIQYRHLFNPIGDGEMEDIVRNAYVTVHKHDSHVSPIDKLIRKKVKPSYENSVQIEDSQNPQLITNKLKEAHKYNNQVLLLIGSVGSGKSTFSTYIKEVALDEQVKEKLLWVRLDLNNAPVNEEEIYTWVKKTIIDKIKKSYNTTDFDSIDTIKKVFYTELQKFDKLAKSLLTEEQYNQELYKRMSDLQSDLDITLQCLIENFLSKESKSVIIVLDNCDKRNLKEQLLMFEVASWIKDTIKAIVFLPLRDTTYDHHKNEKPLDTVVKDLTFRITPPSLDKVIYSRFKYAARLSKKDHSGFYTLPNGMNVTLPKEEEIFYLRCILKSLFQSPFFKKMISGLAGSDIRMGIELFLDFCKSGHISEGEILKIKQNSGNHNLPFYIISRIFLRGDRIYYKDEASRLRNLFYSDPKDKYPNPFIRILMLKWLQRRYKEKGSSGVVGFHSISDLFKDLTALGCEESRLNNELLTLLRQKLILSESQDINEFQNNDLISINTSGLIHLELIYNVDYLSACSEDVWFDSVESANAILQNMSGKGTSAPLSYATSLENSKILKDFLCRYYNDFYAAYDRIVSEDQKLNPIDFEKMEELIENSRYKDSSLDFTRYEIGVVKSATIQNIEHYGLFVNFGDSSKVGFLRKELINNPHFEEDYHIGDDIEVKIICYNESHRKYEVGLPE